jgi:dipeptidyl aminopeptidase/acylaminoacyl peptidase
MIPKKEASVTAVRPSAAQRDGRQIWRWRQRRLWKIRTDGLPRLPRVPSPFFARLRSLLALSCIVAAGSQANSAPPPAEVFGALPAETFAALSPDAHWVAWLDETERKPHIVIFDLNARRIQRMAGLPEQTRLRGLLWSDNETLLATVSEADEVQVATNRARAYFLTIALNPTGEGAVMLPSSIGHATGVAAAIQARMIRAETTKPHTVIMSSGALLFEVDTITGKAEKIKVGNEHTVGWAVDRDGKVVAREDWDWSTGAYRLYALKEESIKEILRADDSNTPTLVGLLPDDSALVLLASKGHAHQSAWMIPLDGSPQKLLAEDPDADITAAYTDAHTGAIVGFYESGTKTTVQWLDPDAQRRQEVLQRSFPNSKVEVYGWTIDGAKSLALVQTPSSPPIYYLIDFKTHRADIAAEEYPALAGVKLGELKEITYKARDGTDIPAYLTLPPEATSGVHPLVVLPHGSANGRDYPYFNWIVQFLASRGYAVLQPQFRGSSGFGQAFAMAGYRQWGGLMQDDVTDGVRAMIDQKVADPQRVCIVGFSYGGYASLAGAAFTPDLYACAISVNGISDLRSMLNETVPQSRPGVWKYSASMSEWTERIGAPNDPALDRKSPIHSVASIKAPILIIYGSSDSVVPNAQSLKMEQALRSAGKQVALVKLVDEDHALSHTETRVQMLKAFEDFLHYNLQKAQPE